MPFTDMPNLLPIPSMSTSQAVVTPGPMTQSPYMTEMGPSVHVGADHGWSRLSLDLNSGPEAGEGESTRDDGMQHGRLPPLHPGAPANFQDLSATLAQGLPGLPGPAAKRKEPEGGWNQLHTAGVQGLYKQQQPWR
jgi:hypothetical protein